MPQTAQDRLTEAQLAYHELMTGTAVVEVRDSTGESVRYSRADASKLRAYIEELKLEVAGTSTARRPMKLSF